MAFTEIDFFWGGGGGTYLGPLCEAFIEASISSRSINDDLEYFPQWPHNKSIYDSSFVADAFQR